MIKARLLPAVVAAATCLLLLKTLGLSVRGGYTIGWQQGEAERQPVLAQPGAPPFGRALSKARAQDQLADPEHTGAFGAGKFIKDDSAKEDPVSMEAKRIADERAKAKPVPQNTSPAERQLLERLQERRDTIEGRSQELEIREGLLKAAEQKLEGRIGDLQSVESKVFEQAREKEKKDQSQIKTLVTMYETMKPKEAARVFDRLEVRILLSVATQMNPRKMAEVLAAMSPEAAERLTVAMATAGKGMEPKPSGELPPAELQRIQPKKPPPGR